jgi:transposase
MHLKSILTRVERHKCFVYKRVRFVDGVAQPELEVEIEPRLTTSYRWFLARWAKRLSWKEMADAFSTTWDNVFRSVKHAVEWGFAHRDLSGIDAIGVDEIQWRSGHTYLTLVYQTDGVERLLWVAQERNEQSLRGFFISLTTEVRSGIRFVCSDTWKPYLKVIAQQIPAALHVLDRFHIMRNTNMALDEVRRAEVAQLRRDGYEPILTKAGGTCSSGRRTSWSIRRSGSRRSRSTTSRASELICSARSSSGSGSIRARRGQ